MEVHATKLLQVSIRNAAGEDHVISEAIRGERITIDAAVPLLQKICDTVIFIQRKQKSVSCAAGCSRCCYQLVPISPAEAIFLHKVVQNLPRARRRQTQRDLESLENRATLLRNAGNDSSRELDAKYFAAQLPCPFLKNHRCSIYLHRPLACREYHVNSPKQLCDDPYRSHPQRTVRGLNMASLLAAFCNHVFGLRQAPIPLFEIEKWGNDHPLARITFEADWLLSKLLHGVTKAASSDELQLIIHWRFSDTTFTGLMHPAEDMAPDSDCNRTRTKENEPTVLLPSDPKKLAAQEAGAANIRKIVDRLLSLDPRLKEGHPIIEIGAGAGYFRYLGSLSSEPYVRNFFKHVVETEADASLVADVHARGGRCLLLNARDVAEQFGPKSTPLVISFNVLDVLSADDLREVLASVTVALQDNGRLAHIMSSSIHESVFANIAAGNSDKKLLPLFSEGAVGVVLLPRSLVITGRLGELADRPDLLVELFRRSPDQYLSVAAEVAAWIERAGLPHERLLLHDFSLKMLATAVAKAGYEIEYSGTVESTLNLPRGRIAIDVGEDNVITSVLGVLNLERDPALPPGQIRQSSKFCVLIARKDETQPT